METANVPVDALHWGLAIFSIVALLVFLVPLRWRAPEAAPMAMFTAALVSLLAFETPWRTLAVASGKGVWDAIFVLYVMWPALLLYQVTRQAGAYDALRQGITRFSRNELFIIVALSWVFSSFLQGIAGFGASVAVVVPLLIAVGVRPVHAVAMGVLAHAWARFFGTLGVAWLATLRVADLDDLGRAAFECALLILIPTYLGGFFVAWLYGRWPAVRHAWPLVVIIGTIMGVGQLLVALFSPELSTFLAAAASVLALYPLSRWRRYREPIAGIGERPAVAFLVTSRTLDHSGQILTIAHGIAAVAPPMVYAGIASTIGALGAFMTSSSTASNVLFAGVQAEVAHAHELRTETIIAAQAAGSTYGNAIAPANIVLGTSVCGIKGQEGAVLRLTLPWTIVVALLTGAATIALVLLD